MTTCPKCLGSGEFSDCIDDMCHGSDRCVHGDDTTCSECGGEGEVGDVFAEEATDDAEADEASRNAQGGE